MVSERKLLPIHLRDFQSSVAVRIVQPVYCVVVFLLLGDLLVMFWYQGLVWQGETVF